MNNSKISKNKSKNKPKAFTFINLDKNVSLSAKLCDNAKKDTSKESSKAPLDSSKEPVKEAAENSVIENQVRETIETIETIEKIDAIEKSVEIKETERGLPYFDKLSDEAKGECIRCGRKRVPGSDLCQFHIDRLKRKAEEERKARVRKERARRMKISLLQRNAKR